jgi:hypothetical protein
MPGPVDDLDHSGSRLPALGHKIGIDATRKGADEGYERSWPPALAMDFETRALVTRRWSEYGLDDIEPKALRWSGQGVAALHALLTSAAYAPGSVDPAALRATGVPAVDAPHGPERRGTPP